MAWEVALAVGGSLTGVAVVVALVVVVAMCTVSRHHCNKNGQLMKSLTIKFTEGPYTPSKSLTISRLTN